MGKKELYELIDAYWAEYKDKTENKPENKLKNGKYISDYVVGSMPIVWFGDLDAYMKSNLKILTMGLNPSDNEFRNKVVENSCFRFPAAEKLDDIKTDKDRKTIIKAYNDYFIEEPCEWFEKGYRKVLTLFSKALSEKDGKSVNYGYKDDVKDAYKAIHIDFFSALATSPAWGSLEKVCSPVRTRLKKNGKDLFENLYELLDPDVIIFHQNKEVIKGISKIIKGLPIGKDSSAKKYSLTSNKGTKWLVKSCRYNGKLFVWVCFENGRRNSGNPWSWIDVYNPKNIKNIKDMLG